MGRDEGDIGFLEEAREMRSLSILSHKLLDLSPLNNLAKLERLSIQCRTSSDVHIDRHTNLEYLALDWSPKFKGLFDCQRLKNFDLFYFSDKDAQRRPAATPRPKPPPGGVFNSVEEFARSEVGAILLQLSQGAKPDENEA